jgi:prevent-host-death family protein
VAQFNVHEAKSNLSHLLDLALSGEEVIIARHGTPVASLAPIRTQTGDRILGAGRGSVIFLSPDWNSPATDDEADEFWEGRW